MLIFSEQVLNQMVILSSKYEQRQSFSLFLGTHLSHIREEMFTEFKEHISDSDFELYFRKAIMSYEGISE